MKFAIHRSKHRLNRKFRKKWISIIPTVRGHSVVLFISFFKQRSHMPFLWEEETCLPRKRAHVPRPLAHSACSPCPQPLTLRAHLSGAPFHSTAPLPHFFFFLKWTFSFFFFPQSNWGKCNISISDCCFICYHEKKFFVDLGHSYICELCFPVFYSFFALFEFLFSIFIIIVFKRFVLYWSMTG